MLKTRELTYEGGGLKVRLVLSEATVLMGMRRALLQGRAGAYLDTLPKEDGIDTTARTLLVRLLYPDLLAVVIEAEGLSPELSVAEFLELPEQLTDAWQNLVYEELNPHWYPFRRPGEDEAAEKNAAAPASGKSGSSS